MLNSYEATVQRYNALLHQEPWSSISHCVFWILFWTISTPIVIWALILQLMVNLLYHYKILGGTIEPKQTPNVELAVVVTGCDTGLGKDLVWEVAREGFVVFAGCLQESSFEQFQLEPRIIPMKMDVTSDAEVQSAAEIVSKWLDDDVGEKDGEGRKHRNRYLHAVVNNAGVAVTGLVDWLDISDFDKQMQVNFYGMVRTVKAFYPILKNQAPRNSPRHYGNARIVNMISAAGLNASGLPACVGYEASKNAAEAFTASLRWEMKLWNVHVTAVNPSFHETQLVVGVVDNLTKSWNGLPPERRDDYGTDYFEHLKTFVTEKLIRFIWPAQIVSEEVVKCIKSFDPPAQILVGSDCRFGMTLGRLVPAWARTMCYTVFDFHSVKPAKMRQ